MDMKKKLIAGITMGVVGTAAIATPFIIFALNLNDENKLDERLKKQLNQQATVVGPNLWWDSMTDSRTEATWAKKVPTAASDSMFSWGKNSSEADMNRIRGVINPTSYSKEEIKKDFAFTHKDNSEYVHNFLENYFKWNDSNVLAYTPVGIQWNSHYPKNTPSIVVVESQGGPEGMVGEGYWKFTREFHKRLTTNRPDALVSGLNVYPVIFNQSQYSFVPSQYIKDLDQVSRDALFAKVAANKNYAKYHKQFTDDAMSEYVALKFLVGNLDLKPSELFEVVSYGMTEINAIRKEALIDKIKTTNQKVVLEGSSFGHEEIMNSIMVQPSILDKVHSAMPALNYMHKWIRGSLVSSGGIKTEKDDKEYEGNPGEVDYSLYYATRYWKIKYGTLENYKQMFDKSSNATEVAKHPELNNFKTNFQSKVHIYLGNRDWNVGSLSNYEKSFYDANNIDYKISDAGHDTRAFPGRDEYVSKILGIKNDPTFTTREPLYLYR